MKSTEHLIYRNGIKKYLLGELSKQYAKAFEYIWTIDHPDNQVYRARPLCKFNIPYKKKDAKDIYQYLRVKNNPNIIQDTKFAKILLDGCAITNSTPSSKNIEELLDTKNDWDTPRNSNYKLE
ncbi:34440_t:CDS:2 [Gigaspora margarita]|uniref:34440_t:CDS:1 n=1 Tax=Gigaspora margarita TaxID=4874 RepID=A0ABN7V8P7_GIGMA|nr:34440_t:CDS:2 [Gigaspora margarita]